MGRTGLSVPIFYDVADVEPVYQLVIRLRSAVRKSA
jgi:hypothetical protein